MKILFNTKRGRPRKDLNEEEKNGLKRSFLAVKSAAPTLEGKTMYMLTKLMANVAISNVCIIVEFAQSSGHYKRYRESRCH